MDLHIVYQDNHLFVVKKEHNIAISVLDEQVKTFLSEKVKKSRLSNSFELDVKSL